MRLPEDYDDRSGVTPAVTAAIIVVTLVVAVILVVVLMMNSGTIRGPKTSGGNMSDKNDVSSPVISSQDKNYSGGSRLHPEDLDFWNMYPEPTEEPIPEETKPPKEVVEKDPSKDGKHTLVKYDDGREEWVLISPYLPKHGFDFTKLVCQSNLMKYYENGKKVSYVGVDISKVQDYIDFLKVKKAGIDFCMIRVGVRGYGTGQLMLDDYFSENIKRATDAGLDVGVYFFSQAVSEEEAVEEANFVIEQLGEYQIVYPVVFDMEKISNDTARTDSLTRADRTTVAKAFLDTIAASGRKAMIYGNKEWLIKEIDMSKLTAYDVWLSQQEDIPDYPYRFAMWQYSFDGVIDGISGKVGLNISFIDYSEK